MILDEDFARFCRKMFGCINSEEEQQNFVCDKQ